MARILSVTFETAAHARPRRFSVPRRVADFLGIGDDDEVELSVMCGGLKLELRTQLRSGLEVYHRVGDASTAGLDQIPAKAPLEVTVWAPDREEGAPRPVRRAEPWTPERFDQDMERRAGAVVLRRARLVREWAVKRGLRLWWGRGFEWGGWVPVYDPPSGRGYQFFELWSSGNLEVQFKYLGAHPAFSSREAREELRRRLNAIPGISLPPEVVDRLRSFRLGDLRDERALQQLLAVFGWVLDQLKGDDQ
jgi:hypothetical protein